MIGPVAFADLIAADPLAPIQTAIVETVATLLPGVSVRAHPGKVDVSELVSRSVVAAPGVGIGWSRIRRAAQVDGAYGASVEWVAYIVAEAKAVAGKRVEKEAVGFAIGQQILRMLADSETCFWGRTGILPPEEAPLPELKPLMTIRDEARGAAYYTVAWTQIVADLGEDHFPHQIGHTDPDAGTIDYETEEAIDAIRRFIPAEEDDGDA